MKTKKFMKKKLKKDLSKYMTAINSHRQKESPKMDTMRRKEKEKHRIESAMAKSPLRHKSAKLAEKNKNVTFEEEEKIEKQRDLLRNRPVDTKHEPTLLHEYDTLHSYMSPPQFHDQRPPLPSKHLFLFFIKQ